MTMAITRAISKQASCTARGRQAENKARGFLETNGLRLLACNYHAPCGELDLIMRDGVTIVFVEVRLRRSARFGDAAASITARKRARITATAAYYLQRHRELANKPCRFDVVAYTGPEEIAEPHWLKGAFGV